MLASTSPDTLLVAAGGVADGRGLAAALALGADGVLVGTRLCASHESLVKPLHKQAILDADGDSTLRTHLPDVVRELPWPHEFTASHSAQFIGKPMARRRIELAQQIACRGSAVPASVCRRRPGEHGRLVRRSRGPH